MRAPLEAEIQRDILLAASGYGCRLLRNNVGMFEDKTGRWVHYGVGGNGGADLIGWTDVHGSAVFTAIEVKRRGKKPTQEQANFIDAVDKAGGIAAVCYSVEDFKAVVNGYRSMGTGLRERRGEPSTATGSETSSGPLEGA